MALLKDFKDFAIKGNLVDMAVGLILGAAFGKIVSSLVKDVLMPPIGKAMGGVDFSKLFVNLTDTPYESLAAATEAGAPVIRHGLFFQSIIDFVIVAFVVFLVVKVIQNAQKKQEETAAPAEDLVLLREIRDSLKK